MKTKPMKLIGLIVSLMLGCSFGAEVIKPGAVTMHHMPCESFGGAAKACDGEMIACSGVVLTSIPPQYPHKCSKCGRMANYTQNYPYSSTEDADKISVGLYGSNDAGLTNVPLNAPEFELDHAIRTVPAILNFTNAAIVPTNFTYRTSHDHPGSNYICGDMVTHRYGGIASWTQWEFLTNQPTRLREVTFADNVTAWATDTNYIRLLGRMNVTNFWQFDYSPPPCTREHWDESPKQEITYNQSNLLSFVSFRGQTNMQCMESICVATNVRTWHWKREKVYDK